jgi:putative membrane protein
MTNQQLLKTAHVWSAGILLVFLVLAIAMGVRGSGSIFGQQNSNSNANSNSSAQNQNAKSERTTNRNSANTNAQGERAGMAAASSQDSNFMMDAAMAGLMEVELGRMATTQGSSDAVKQFGQRMVDDHSRANTELMQLASSKGATLPTAIDDKHQKDIAKFSKLSGADFDKAYSKQMLSDHNKAVSLFEKESTKGTDPELKSFAAKTLPTLQEHLQIVKSLPGNTTGDMKSTNSNSNRSTGNSNKNSNSNRP